MSFSISVVIPVYNCEQYIEKAVASALQQPEVLEVVVVNDGSIDKTQEILTRLVTKHQKLKVFNHPNNLNKGRSASRNLGIKKASGNYIAFLDADDYYLPNRFSNDKVLFEQSEDIDGIYNAIGTHLYREIEYQEEKQLLSKLFTINKVVEPYDLFDTIMSGNYGYFSIDGMTLKRTIVENIGGFNESLVVAEDTDFILKLSLKYDLYPGQLDKPLAMRGIHTNNVFNNKELYSLYDLKMYESLYFWTIKSNFALNIVERFLERIWIIHFNQKKDFFSYIKIWFGYTMRYPKILFTTLSIKYFPLIRLRQKLFPFLYNNSK
ncbi:MAG: glycosyltransferase family 2 protein [Flaviramulus sp.]|nr:glycosyltransferase family 2 protein [Flaviramulus sp.]NNC50245.1 glycosyltransferase family 2 protein [Flaviramulus sp.]